MKVKRMLSQLIFAALVDFLIWYNTIGSFHVFFCSLEFWNSSGSKI